MRSYEIGEVATPALTIIATTAGWALVFGTFYYVVRARLIARFANGFLISLLVALVGVALTSASIVGMWGYESAEQVLNQELVIELQNVGTIVERQILNDLDRVDAQLSGLGRALLPLVGRTGTVGEVTDDLRSAQSVNNRFLNLYLLDPHGRRVASANRSIEDLDEHPLTLPSLEDGPSISEPYASAAFKRQVLDISLPIRGQDGAMHGVLATQFDLSGELASLIAASRFGESGYAFMVDGDGRIIAHPDRTRLGESLLLHPAVRLARQSGGVGEVVATNPAGVERLFVYRAVRNPSTLTAAPWVLLTEINENEELAPLHSLRRELIVGMALSLVGSIFMAFQLSHSIEHPLVELESFARRIGLGDLTGRIRVAGVDVVSRLAGALNEMADGLQERDHIKDVFGRYLSNQIAAELLKGQASLGGEARVVTMLFSDIRNFTGMSEMMTPQQVVSFLNEYFSEMVDVVFDHDGVLDKFIGDGLLAVFGSFGNQPDHAVRAVDAALAMTEKLAALNERRRAAGLPPVAIGIGIHTDEVVVGNIGSRKRLEYTVVGDGVNTAARLESLNKEFGTTILVSESSHRAVRDLFNCRELPEATLRGKVRKLRFYEVLGRRSQRTS